MCNELNVQPNPDEERISDLINENAALKNQVNQLRETTQKNIADDRLILTLFFISAIGLILFGIPSIWIQLFRPVSGILKYILIVIITIFSIADCVFFILMCRTCFEDFDDAPWVICAIIVSILLLSTTAVMWTLFCGILNVSTWSILSAVFMTLGILTPIIGALGAKIIDKNRWWWAPFEEEKKYKVAEVTVTIISAMFLVAVWVFFGLTIAFK